MKQTPVSQPTMKPTLEQVRDRFETWRRGKKAGSRIPKCLWTAAVEVCEEHPVWQVSRVLRLNYNELKRRVNSSGHLAVCESQRGGGFVELTLGTSPQVSECTVELENAAGAKLKMRFCGGFDPLELARAFWRQGS